MQNSNMQIKEMSVLELLGPRLPAPQNTCYGASRLIFYIISR